MSESAYALVRRLEATLVRQRKAVVDSELQLEAARKLLQPDLPLEAPRRRR